MWFWLVSLLTIVLSPLALLFGRPVARPSTAWRMFEPWGGPVGSLAWTFKPLGTRGLRYLFPWSSKAIAWRWAMHPWVERRARKAGAAAFTALGFVFVRGDVAARGGVDKILAHEALHVVQQAAHPLAGPVGMYVTYLLDLLQWFGWRKALTLSRSHATMAEQICYSLTSDDPWV